MTIKNWLQKKFINFLAKHLFNSITEDDVLKIIEEPTSLGKKRIIGVYIRGRKLNEADIDSLKEGAIQFKDSALWKLIDNEIKYAANLRMYIKGTTSDDILAGKIALYTLETIKKIIDRISKL